MIGNQHDNRQITPSGTDAIFGRMLLIYNCKIKKNFKVANWKIGMVVLQSLQSCILHFPVLQLNDLLLSIWASYILTFCMFKFLISQAEM